MRRGLLGLVVLVLVGLYACMACAPPESEGSSSRPTISGRAAFDAWVAANTTTEHDGPWPWAGWYDAANRVVHLDDEKLAEYDATLEGSGEWARVHEAGHAVDLAIGTPQGGTRIGVERGAQCVAEVVLGHGPGYTDDELGYWDCPKDQVDRTRDLMIQLGAWA